MEHGEYKENLYGTSLEAIRSVMAKKKVCLVDVVPEVSSAAYFKECKSDLLLTEQNRALGKAVQWLQFLHVQLGQPGYLFRVLTCCRIKVHPCPSLLRA